MFKHTFKQPQTANDFKVIVKDSDWAQEWIDLISNQTTYVELNLVKKQVTIDVRQMRTGWIQDLIFHILQKDTSNIDEIRLTPAKRQSYEYIFTNGTLIDHEVRYNLYSRLALEHRLIFSFDGVSLHSKEKHALAPVVNLKPVDNTEERVTLME